MKANEIKVGGLYLARIGDPIVTVRVEAINKRESSAYRKAGTSYRCTNLRTGREVTFRSATKFRGPAPLGTPGASRHDRTTEVRRAANG